MKTKLFFLMLIGMMGIGSVSVAAQSTGYVFRFISYQNGSTIGLASLASHQTIEYSVDRATWVNMTTETTVSLNNGESLYMRGVLTDNNTSTDYTQFSVTGNVIAFGNINYLWNYQDLEMPLKEFCGFSLFKGCGALKMAPELPSIKLAAHCYQSMFQNCTGLTSPPSLPATSLAPRCYMSMFQECTSLISAPNLPADTLAEYCYWRMFRGCTALSQIPEVLPASELTTYCYNQMFMQTAITRAPELPAKTLGEYSYYQMFYGCNHLNYIKCLATNISATGCTQGWVNGVSTSGTFVKNSQMKSWTTGNNGIPSSWIISDTTTTITNTNTCGENLTWSFNPQDSTLIIEGSGSMHNYVFYGVNQTPWNDFKSNIKHIIISNGVTSIGTFAFSGCTNLISINIPNSVTSINWAAFNGCTGLISIEIPNSVIGLGDQVFLNCSSLTTIELPNSVTSIGLDFFNGCRSLASITIPNSVTSIGSNAFKDCSSLTTIIIPNGVTSIKSSTFENCSSLGSVTIGDSVTTIDPSAFSGCQITSVIWNAKNCSSYNFGDQVTSFIFGSGVENIPDEICSGMNKLTSIIIPNSVTSIGNQAFSGCSSLNSITIGNNVTTIGNYAFSGCSSLNSITIGNNVTTIGNYAFSGCTRLTSIRIFDIATWCSMSWGSYPFSNAYKLYSNGVLVTNLVVPNNITSIKQYAFYNCSSLKSVEIPNSVTTIGHSAFKDCSNLTSIGLSSNITQIEQSTFENCSRLTAIEIPNSVTTIGGYAFKKCTSLNSIEIPNSVTDMGGDTFFGCSSLSSVTISDSVARIGSGIFANCSSLDSIIIPQSVITINSNAFYNCTSLSSVELQNNLQNIEYYAFRGCSSLTSIVIPETVKEIDNDAFLECPNLRQVTLNSDTIVSQDYGKYYTQRGTESSLRFKFGTSVDEYIIGDNVSSIGKKAFYNCGIKAVTIGAQVKSIPEDAFVGNSSLKTITINSNSLVSEDRGNLSIGYTSSYFHQRFGDHWKCILGEGVTRIGNYAFVDCALTSTKIPRSLTSIGSGNQLGDVYIEDLEAWCSIIMNNNSLYGFYGIGKMFLNDTIVDHLEIPNSITRLGRYAFYKCPSIKSVEMNNVQSIGAYAFEWCDSLTSVMFGNSVTHIEDFAFSDCGRLQSVTCLASTPPTLGTYVFLNRKTNAVLYVPAASIAAYQAADQWKDFYIVAIDQDTIETFTITFVNWDGEELLKLTDVEEGTLPVYTGETPTKPATAQYSYTFKGWTPQVDSVTDNATYTAEFDSIVNEYTISFVNYDGMVLQTVKVHYGTTPVYTKSTPTRPSDEQYTYTFIGWTPEIEEVTEDATYTATYEAKPIGEGVEDVNIDVSPVIILHNGQILILRGEKVYTIQGQEIK